MTCTEVLALYARQQGPEVRSKATLAHCIDNLAPFWSDLVVADIKRETCQRYRDERKRADGTVRRELGVLQAALNHCHLNGYLLEVPQVWLPPPSPPRDRWLTRAEAARLLWCARRTPHVYRFIWLGLFTGTRSKAVLSLQWQPNFSGGHIDLDAGLLFRRSAAERETKKRQTPARLAPAMLLRIARWRASCRQHVIEWRGNPIASVKRGFRDACSRAELAGVSPHTLRHTAITWAMQNGAPPTEVASYFGVTLQELERTYLHHHPDHQKRVGEALLRRRT